MAEKVTIMVLKVDLQCCKCYKKVKKVLCQFPEIQDQVYDEKNNKVTIKVVSCCPERIRDKLCCKGQGCIKSIEILPPPPPPKPRPDTKPETKPESKPETKPEAKPDPKPEPEPPVPERRCCNECCEGRGGGPCYNNNPCYGYCRCPIRCCDGYCRWPVCDSWSGGCGCRCGGGYYVYGCRCRGYYCEQYQPGCYIM